MCQWHLFNCKGKVFKASKTTFKGVFNVYLNLNQVELTMETVFSTIVFKNLIALTLSQNVAGVVNICKFLLLNISPFSAQSILL